MPGAAVKGRCGAAPELPGRYGIAVATSGRKLYEVTMPWGSATLPHTFDAEIPKRWATSQSATYSMRDPKAVHRPRNRAAPASPQLPKTRPAYPVEFRRGLIDLIWKGAQAGGFGPAV
jgi:hypothetical protein